MITFWTRRHRTDLAAAGFILLVIITVIASHDEIIAAGVGVLAVIVYLANYDKIRGSQRHPSYFVVFVWGDVDPSLEGPFETEDERDAKAREIRRNEGDENGIYWLDLTESGKLEVGPYTGGFLDDEEDEAADNENQQFLNHYRCPRCQHEWSDVWTATCDDDCPKCGTRHISPYDSEELKGGAHGSTIQ